MSNIMWRESRCQPDAQSDTSDTGLLQINRINHRWLSDRFDFQVDRHNLTNPEFNVEAAAELFRYWTQTTGNGYQPWSIR